ncbi:MAG: hypothetical protein COB54_03030 [Alphaproteobacteria bacterium]|nr:MAG: hypothetical protein COB54_03030 [Alphaproteobacteria bacterium]
MSYNFSRMALNVAVRLILLCVTLFVLVWVLYSSEKHAVAVILLTGAVVQFWSLLTKLTQSEREMISFLEAIQFSDFSQKLGRKGFGSSKVGLAEAYDKVMGKFKDDRSKHEKQGRYFHALIDHIPVALLSITENQNASLLNNAAKKLFGLSHIHRISDLTAFGPSLLYELNHVRAGRKRLIRLRHNNEELKFSLASTKIIIDGVSSHVVSLHNIQSELDTTQVEAWQDLVHVLTHELMNSLTPVASLSSSMNMLMEDISAKAAQENISDEFTDMLGDLQDGIGAISRRSGHLDSFVSNYRKMTKVPPPDYQHLKVATIFETMIQLFEERCTAENITLRSHVSPPSLMLNADPQLIDQAIINLVKNAVEAVRDTPEACITLKAYIDHGSNSVIEISNNGTGLEEDMLQRIFVPFFTTKKEGSGIGLSLTRQIMLAHHGSINCHNAPEGGLYFRLIFRK